LNFYFDKQGNPISAEEANHLLMDRDYCTIEKTPMMYHDEPVEVSTVWLCVNHQWGEGPPVIFETMVFGGPEDMECFRYSTEKEARDGHAVVVHELVNRAARDRTEQGEE
jgi:hypothetical protein